MPHRLPSSRSWPCPGPQLRQYHPVSRCGRRWQSNSSVQPGQMARQRPRGISTSSP